jgi:hypothetical protein
VREYPRWLRVTDFCENEGDVHEEDEHDVGGEMRRVQERWWLRRWAAAW